MRLRLVTPPIAEPVTLAEAKAHLRIEHALDDAYIGTLITAARQHAEEVCWRAFVTQTWELVLDGFPSTDDIELPKGKLASITSVTYIDDDGASQVLAAAEYETDTVSMPGRLVLAYDATWPATRDAWNAVAVRYVVGEAVGAVPAPVKQAILLLVSQLYEHRTPEVIGATIAPVQFAVDALLRPYRLVRF